MKLTHPTTMWHYTPLGLFNQASDIDCPLSRKIIRFISLFAGWREEDAAIYGRGGWTGGNAYSEDTPPLPWILSPHVCSLRGVTRCHSLSHSRRRQGQIWKQHIIIGYSAKIIGSFPSRFLFGSLQYRYYFHSFKQIQIELQLFFWWMHLF